MAFAGIFSAGSAIAQNRNVGIGTVTPDKSAVLDIQSADKGLLIPRMSREQMNSINTPATGLMVYQTGEKAGFYFYNGKSWSPLTGNGAEAANSVAADPNDWTINGNSISAANFIGSTNDAPLKFRINNVHAGSINRTGGGNVYLGYEAGLSNTGLQNVAVGFNALKTATGASNNIAIGTESLLSTTAGIGNVGLGVKTLKLSTGNNNMAIGSLALENMGAGNSNVAIGNTALRNKTSGNNNIAIGAAALEGNISGSGNVAIGYTAGQNETGSNKLYISNSASATPLIKGEFDNKNLKINTGATTSTTVGFLAVGNFDAAFTMPTGNSYRLIVQDGIITEKVKVALRTTADWADYVFDPSYKLMSLDKVEQFTKTNKHLPNVPSADDMANNGLDVGQTSKMFMEKIEELTLYMIELNKQVQALKSENETLKASKLK